MSYDSFMIWKRIRFFIPLIVRFQYISSHGPTHGPKSFFLLMGQSLYFPWFLVFDCDFHLS